MKNDKPQNETGETGAQAAAPNRSARVRVLKPRLRIGNHIHAKGSETSMTVAEFELRKKDGEVELISLA